MKDYISEQIYNNKLRSTKDIKEGRTGFHYWDSLSQEKRNQIMQESGATLKSMTSKEQAILIDEFQAEIRKKKRADDGKLKDVDNYDAIRELVNSDLPAAIAAWKEELDENHQFELLAKLQGKTDFEILEIVKEIEEQQQ